ncbi:MAG: RNA polymerase sigma factor [Oscillospiraceae bacterium]|jgi:RNA polymerase sigma-70 factor (ECF subfamily)|nr:RNA polymerase sigma factor [Oscillospiraceae bacterium]
MAKPLLRANNEIERLYRTHFAAVYRVCFAYMGAAADAEDAAADTFVKLIRSAPAFDGEEHEKAWLIRTASNVCKDALRHWWRRREDLDDHADTPAPERDEAHARVLDAVRLLPDRYKTPVILYYYHGHGTKEIAHILKLPEGTVRHRLYAARKLLKTKLEGELQ